MPATPASSPAGKAPPSNSTVKIAARLGSPNNAATEAILGSTRISICQLLSPLSFIRSDKNAIAPPTEYSETSQLPPDSPRLGIVHQFPAVVFVVGQAFKSDEGKSNFIRTAQTFL